jgi:putative transposase
VLTGNPGHLKSFDYTGLYRYFLTFCTASRRQVFTSAEAVDLVLLHFVRAATDEKFSIVAYCFLPDHVHLLVEAGDEASDCRRLIQRAKQFSGFYHAKMFGERLWQRHGFERVLRNDEATLVVARYILENPVRAGLVARVQDYRFAGSRVYSLAEILAATADVQRKSG